MQITEYKLDFKTYPPLRKTSFQDKLTRRIYIFTEDVASFDIGLLHQTYKEKGLSGLPYHYVIKNNGSQDGSIFYCRPTVYQNETNLGASVRNCIAIVLLGKAKAAITANQKASLISLCAFLVEQEGLLPEDVMMASVVGGKVPMTSTDWASVTEGIKNNIKTANLYKSFSDKPVEEGADLLTEKTYKFTITSDTRDLSAIAKIIGCTTERLKSLNKESIGTQDIKKLKPGTVIYLPVTNIVKSFVTSAQQGVVSEAIAASVTDKVNMALKIGGAYDEAVSDPYGTDIYSFDGISTKYGGKIFPRWQQETMEFPGYRNAMFQITNTSNNKIVYLPFLISPSSFVDNRSTTQQIAKTNAGWFVMRTGSNPMQLSLSGYMLDIKARLERHEFIANFKKYIEDTKNEQFEYINNYSISLAIEGRIYSGYIQSISFQKTGAQPFIYQYTITFVALGEHQDYNQDYALQSYEELMSKVQQAPVTDSKVVGDTLFNYMSKPEEEVEAAP